MGGPNEFSLQAGIRWQGVGGVTNVHCVPDRARSITVPARRYVVWCDWAEASDEGRDNGRNGGLY